MNECRDQVYTFFMIGNPGENDKTIAQTIRFAKKLNPIFASLT